jgi:hypothetical protein
MTLRPSVAEVRTTVETNFPAIAIDSVHRMASCAHLKVNEGRTFRNLVKV